MSSYNVIVIGGGPAGCAAAISCAKLGQKVLIIESTNALGGAINNMLILPLMPYWTPVRHSDNPTLLVRGFLSDVVKEQIKMMEELDGSASRAKVPFVYYSDEYMKIILPRMAKEAGCDILYHAKFIGCKAENGVVKSISVAAQSKVLELTADRFIDCSGDAELAYQAGFPVQLGREKDNLCQPMTLCFRLGDCDVPKFYQNNKLIQTLYKEAKARGEIHNLREDVLVFEHISPTVLHFNTTRIVKRNPVDPFDLSLAESEVREQVYEMYRFLKKYCPGCEKATLLQTASHIGVRESRMIVGEYVLSTDDIKNCTKFDDGIAACNYDIDIHNPEGTGTSHYFFKDYTYYTIPYRSLIPKESKNLLVAGRCISSSHDAQASYRVIPFAMAIGQAAGVAAANSLKENKNVKDISIENLLNTLRSQGAFVEKELDP